MKLTRSVSLLPLILLALVWCSYRFSTPVKAFKTFEAFGGAIHREITQKGLTPQGFSERTITQIVEGNTWSDLGYGDPLTGDQFNGGFLHDNVHCDGNMFRECLDYIKAQRKKTVAETATSYTSGPRKALYEFGKLLHTAQDFYSHANWIELQLDEGYRKELPKLYVPKSVDEFKLIDWETDLPPTRVKSGHFWWEALGANEVIFLDFAPHLQIPGLIKPPVSWPQNRTAVLGGLLKANPKLNLNTTAGFEAVFDAKEFKYRSDPKSFYPEAFLAVQNAISSFDELHYFLNKDDPKQPAGAPRWGAWTLHEYAKATAVKETVRQWQLLENAIRTEYPDKSDLIIAAMKSFDRKDVLAFKSSNTDTPGSTVVFDVYRANVFRLVNKSGRSEYGKIRLDLSDAGGNIPARVRLYEDRNGQFIERHEVIDLSAGKGEYLWGVFDKDDSIYLHVEDESQKPRKLRVTLEKARHVCKPPPVPQYPGSFMLDELDAAPELLSSSIFLAGFTPRRQQECPNCVDSEKVPEVLAKQTGSYIAARFSGVERDLKSGREVTYSPKNAYVMGIGEHIGFLKLGFDGKSVELNIVGTHLVTFISYPDWRRANPPESYYDPVLKKTVTKTYDKYKNNLLLQFLFVGGSQFPSNIWEVREGSNLKIKRGTGSFVIDQATMAGLRGHYLTPYHLEFRDYSGKLERYANVTIEGCFFISGRSLQLSPDVTSMEALEDLAKFQAENEEFQKKNEAFLKRHEKLIESIKTTRNPSGLLKKTQELQAIQKEAVAMQKEGLRIGALQKQNMERAQQRSQRVWEILKEPVTIRP